MKCRNFYPLHFALSALLHFCTLTKIGCWTRREYHGKTSNFLLPAQALSGTFNLPVIKSDL